ncbi:MAG: rane protein [Nonomuraea muscovyensis]|nr:rane protein [Nonomuraea muscovyensis]
MDGALHTAAIALLVFVSVAVITIRAPLARARSRAVPSGPPQLELYEAAYLAGGPRRVLNTALASLVAQHGLRVSSEGTVTPVHGFRPAKRAPVERVVHRHVASTPGGSATAEIRHAVAGHEVLRRLAITLSRRGLLVPPPVRARAHRRSRWLLGLAALAVVVAVAGAFPVFRAGAAAIAALAAVAGVACFFWVRRLMADPLTRAGRAALDTVDVNSLTAGAADGTWRASDDLGVLAVNGLTELPDRRLADALARDNRARDRVYTTCCAPGHCGAYSTGGFSTTWHGGSPGGGWGESGGSGGGWGDSGADFGGSLSTVDGGGSSCGSGGCGGGGT